MRHLRTVSVVNRVFQWCLLLSIRDDGLITSSKVSVVKWATYCLILYDVYSRLPTLPFRIHAVTIRSPRHLYRISVQFWCIRQLCRALCMRCNIQMCLCMKPTISKQHLQRLSWYLFELTFNSKRHCQHCYFAFVRTPHMMAPSTSVLNRNISITNSWLKMKTKQNKTAWQ